MARLIRVEASGPIKIEPAQFPRDEQGNLKPMFICACGLSKNSPFCDGAHKACRASEQAGTLYVYDRDRTAVVEERRDT
ncbi:MAG: CDGSH iron-sulfur domain-containing protein [Phycisphaeraceae bacterium]|nr:CDGSH iron-sulfur domain-containing protein [Phycisphaeraceae bacterium]